MDLLWAVAKIPANMTTSSFNQVWQVLLLIASSAFVVMALVQWWLWLLSWGRFAESRTQGRDVRTPLRFLAAEFFTKLINDFRHLLALVVMMVFGGSLLGVFILAPLFKDVKDGLQVVAATMGGLVGSIIGYYFGESAGKTSLKEAAAHNAPPTSPLVQRIVESQSDDLPVAESQSAEEEG